MRQRSDLVRLLIDRELTEHKMIVLIPRVDHVQRGLVSTFIDGSAKRLAVDGDESSLRRDGHALGEGNQHLGERAGVHRAEHPLERVRMRRAWPSVVFRQVKKHCQPGRPLLSPAGDLIVILALTKRRQQRHRQQTGQRETHMAGSGIRHLFKIAKQTAHGFDIYVKNLQIRRQLRCKALPGDHPQHQHRIKT